MSTKIVPLVSTFALTICLFSVPLAAQDWPQYRGPDATGRISAVNIDLGSGKLKTHWKVSSGVGFSSFAVSEGRAITVIGREDSEVCIAVDVDSGKELWATTLGTSDYGSGGGNAGAQGNKGGDGPRSTPAISNDQVFIYDAHLKLHCLEIENGKRIWSHDIGNDFDGRNIKWKNATSPLIDDQHIYIAGGGKDQSFLCFDKKTGKLKWKTGNEKMTHASPALANSNGKSTVIFFMQFGLIALETETGKELWRREYPFNVSTAASPVVKGNQVYCSAGYGVGAGMFDFENVNSPKEVWRKPNRLINHWSSPVLFGDHLYGLYRFKRYGTAPLQCVDFATGEINWSQTGFGQGNCIVVGDKIVVLSDSGELAIVAATPTQYTELWRGQVVEGKCWSTPAFYDGKIFVRSTKEAACLSFE